MRSSMRHSLKWAISAMALLWLAGCATAPPPPVDASLFADALFAAPSQPIHVESILAIDDDMRAFLKTRTAGRVVPAEKRHWLVEALYNKGELQLEYDTAATRNASEAFHARSGNCLSLVLMTAALAKEMGLFVRFQNVSIEETWGRQGDLYVSFAHVNVTLGEQRPAFSGAVVGPDALTVDFVPPKDVRFRRAREIREDTVLAMYMNNRAVESLALGRVDDAYAWAHAALDRAPDFGAAYNTLALVYRGRQQPLLAERVLNRLLTLEPNHPHGLSNLALVLHDQGRSAEADALTQRLRALQPDPPYAFFDRGRAAMQAGDFRAAHDWFQREVDRAPNDAEFHFWLAIAELQLGNVTQATRQLAKARDASPTRGERELYAAKLERLRAVTP